MKSLTERVPEMSSVNAGNGGGVTAASPFVGIVTEIISNFIRTGIDNQPLYYNLSLYLASGIDLAITNNEVPSRSSDIPQLLKQMYNYKKGSSFEAAFMVLMIAVKSACKAGWFSKKETDDLELMTKVALKCFSSPEDVDIGPSCALPYISNILSRCHPHIKVEKILFSIGVKAGFGAYVSDFHVSREAITSQHEKICLFVAQMEKVDSSSHTVSPPQINLMLNGKTVQNEIKNYMDIGQQLLTNVTLMLEDGVNLLQAVGHFNGSYAIALATTRTLPSSGDSEFHDYNQPVVASVDSGSSNRRTSWQISLNCPISQCRIGIPVKGRLCKHRECFDYEAFLAMNSKEPSWRCPHCNLQVGRTDLFVDQKFSKILRETPIHVSNVIFSEDGSWKPVSGRKDCLEKNLWSDILHSVSSAVGKVPVASNCPSTTIGNVKPTKAPLNTRPSPVALQSMNQPTAVQSTQQLPPGSSDGPRLWLSQKNSTTLDKRIGKMRGSLTGEAYEAALSRLLSPPIQPARALSQPTISLRHPLVIPEHSPPPEYNPTKL